jgi:ribonuclease HI
MCGLSMAKEERISNLIVFGDSLLVIQEINEKGCPSDNKLNMILRSIKRLVQSFDQIQFFHIKRELNTKASH